MAMPSLPPYEKRVAAISAATPREIAALRRFGTTPEKWEWMTNAVEMMGTLSASGEVPDTLWGPMASLVLDATETVNVPWVCDLIPQAREFVNSPREDSPFLARVRSLPTYEYDSADQMAHRSFRAVSRHTSRLWPCHLTQALRGLVRVTPGEGFLLQARNRLSRSAIANAISQGEI